MTMTELMGVIWYFGKAFSNQIIHNIFTFKIIFDTVIT